MRLSAGIQPDHLQYGPETWLCSPCARRAQCAHRQCPFIREQRSASRKSHRLYALSRCVCKILQATCPSLQTIPSSGGSGGRSSMTSSSINSWGRIMLPTIPSSSQVFKLAPEIPGLSSIISRQLIILLTKVGSFPSLAGLVYLETVQKTGVAPDLWRYYLISHRPETGDTEFNWDSFISANKNLLLKNLGNFVNHVVKFVNSTKFHNIVPDYT